MNGTQGLFVTGTDTGVGKTVITGALVAALRAEGGNVGVWKPVQTGGLAGEGTTDAELLLKYTGMDSDAEDIASFTFEAPLAPMLAAKQTGLNITLQDILSAGESILHRYDSVFIEGAGGVAVPITKDALTTDLIAELQTPVLIVARSGLGTINHTLLTMEYLERRGISILGFILNDGLSGELHLDPSVETNGRIIEHYSGIPCLGHFPELTGEIDSKRLIHAVQATINLSPVRDALTIQKMEEYR
ncbi:dethiobiotin synthase [Paenibacillus sp. 2TAF8]|jgi:dethiobiotin synthetase|uniref:dethiobiotin synthase n=1 Tax=Paenibacillus sp. 2TAF8 TaxID=3233020 RepID=UPI003F96CEBE